MKNEEPNTESAIVNEQREYSKTWKQVKSEPRTIVNKSWMDESRKSEASKEQ